MPKSGVVGRKTAAAAGAYAAATRRQSPGGAAGTSTSSSGRGMSVTTPQSSGHAASRSDSSSPEKGPLFAARPPLPRMDSSSSSEVKSPASLADDLVYSLDSALTELLTLLDEAPQDIQLFTPTNLPPEQLTRHAINMFHQSTGCLFYIYPAEQLPGILSSVYLNSNMLEDPYAFVEVLAMACCGCYYDVEQLSSSFRRSLFFSCLQNLKALPEINHLRCMRYGDCFPLDWLTCKSLNRNSMLTRFRLFLNLTIYCLMEKSIVATHLISMFSNANYFPNVICPLLGRKSPLKEEKCL